MQALKVNGLGKAYGVHELFKDVWFEVARGEKVGFVGQNGAGKTTLLRCLLGQEEYDTGSVQLSQAATIGYVEQQADFGGGTLYEEFESAFADIIALGEKKKELEKKIASNDDEKLLQDYGKVAERFESLGGYNFASRIKKVAFGLGFTEKDFAKAVSAFSGGQRTRIGLAKALLREPDFLFLDEPTNHLDIESIEWLENFLHDYPGGVLLISHDRFFLDRVVTRVLEIENKRVTNYAGNYSYYTKVKAERRAALKTAFEKQQEYIHKTEEYIRRYKAGIKSKQARGREKQLNRLERITLPPEAAAFNYFAFHAPAECAQRVLDLEDVSAAYGSQQVFSNLSLNIRKGDGVALVGPNGAGKTTLLKIILGEMETPTGRVKIGNRVKVGYFSQQHEGLHPESTVLEEITYSYGIDEEKARQYLGAFLFRGDDVYRLVGELSGGEQSRLAFLKLMLTGANFLVLDEPTNHLDIPAKEAVEEALMAFTGTFLVVSHDRYFLDKVTNYTVELADGVLTPYEGSYSYYRQKKELLLEEAREEAEARKKKQSAAPGAKPAAVSQPKQQAKKADKVYAGLSDAKKQELLQRAEAEIAMAEAELKGIEFQLNQPEVQSQPEKSREMAAAYAAKEKEIEERYQKWEKLMEA